MPRLFVANCTNQNYTFYYRLDFRAEGQDINPNLKIPKTLPIRSGRQIPFPGDLHEQQIKELISQLRRYGALDVSEVKGKIRTVVPLVFSIGSPVSEHIMRHVHGLNNGIKINEGEVRRSAAAVAANEALTSHVGDAPPEFEVSIEQEGESGLGEKPLAVGFRRDDAKPGPTKPPRRAAQRRAA